MLNNILQYLKYLKNPFVFSVVLGVFMVILFMIDAHVYSRDKDKTDYLKIFGSVVLSSLSTHYYLRNNTQKSVQKGGYTNTQATPMPTNYNTYDNADVFDENPNF